MAELPKDIPLVSSAFLIVITTGSLLGFGKEAGTMRYKSTIWLIGIMAVVLIFTGIVTGETMWPSAVDEQRAQTQEFVKIKCDPCDYNVDYGGEYLPIKK
jgi:hypothetical protein